MEKVVNECNGCERITAESTCKAYVKPALRWQHWNDGEGLPCWLATHVVAGEKRQQEGKRRIGQQKQRKVRR